MVSSQVMGALRLAPCRYPRCHPSIFFGLSPALLSSGTLAPSLHGTNLHNSFSVSSAQKTEFLQSTSASIPVSDSSHSILDQLSIHLISHPLEPLSYTATVVLATLLVRSTTTLPISIWSRFRTHRFESIVLPQFKKYRSNLALGAKRKFLHPSQIAVYQSHLQAQLGKELKRLIAENRCKPSTTILVSLGVHVPVIYSLTTILRQACHYCPPGSPLDLEKSPLLGLSLMEPDLGLALICWAAFLINVELNASFRYLRRSTETTNQSSSPTISSSKNISFLSRGLSFWNPQKIRTASFLAGIGMMGLSASQPALVVIYWLTSNCFSILQSLCFIYLDYRQKTTQSLLNSTDQISSSQNKDDGKIRLRDKHHIISAFKGPSKPKPPSSSMPPIL